MCYHNSIAVEPIKLEKRYDAHLEEGESFSPIFHASGFSFPQWPVITVDKPDTIQLFNWGLIPHWTKTREDGLDFRKNTLNAVSETAFEKPSFKYSIKQKRCLIPSTGFFEWQDYNKKKYPYFITLKEQKIFSMAGLYQNWTDKETGEVFNTFSILTTKANPLMERVHNLKKRMPVILNPANEKDWILPALKDEDYQGVFLPFNEDLMHAHTISKLITSRVENPNVPEVQEEFIYEELDPA